MTDQLLLTPVILEALVVGSKVWIADKTPNFDKLSTSAPLPSSLVNRPFNHKQCLPGVHLHWVLPDALLKGIQNEEGQVVYPCVPNRWLLQRLSMGSEKIERAIWLIESDFLTNDLYEDKNQREYQLQTTITIPTLRYVDGRWAGAGKNGSYHAYLGTSRAWGTPNSLHGSYLERLTAIGAGDPTFAAYYPNCKSVFGFHDKLDGIEQGEFTYVLCGYYENEAQSPLYRAENLRELLDEMKWSINGAGEIPFSILCHGTLTGVRWEGHDKTYETAIPSDPIDVTVGNTSMEALSLVVKNKLEKSDSGKKNIERMLTALQYNLLGDLDNKENPDAGIELEERMHTQQFAQSTGRSCWNAWPADIAATNKKLQIPPALYPVLQEINQLQRQLDSDLEKLGALRAELYFTWYKYVVKTSDRPIFKAGQNEETDDSLYTQLLYNSMASDHFGAVSAKDLLDDLNAQITEAQALTVRIRLADDGINKLTSDSKTQKLLCDYDLRLEKSEKERYYTANNPILLFSGEGMRRTFHQRCNGQYSADDKLACRIMRGTAGAIAAIRVNICGSNVRVGAEQLLAKCSQISPALPAPVQAMTVEAILLSPSFAGLIADIAIAQTKLKIPEKERSDIVGKIRQAQSTYAGMEGVIPSPLAHRVWSQPWSPLFMEWSLKINPVRSNSTLDNSFDFYTLGEIDFAPIEAFPTKGVAAQDALNLSGSTIITPHAVTHLSEMLQKLINDYGSGKYCDDLKKAAQVLRDLPILSQSMDGLNEALIMRESILQIPVIDVKNKNPELVKRLTQVVDKFHYSPNITDVITRFFPIRAGFIEKYRIRMVDSFGQIKEFEANKAKAFISESMRTECAQFSGQAALLPRFMLPCRLSFTWLSHQSTTVESGQDPDTSPIIGFIAPNFIDRCLQVYDNSGHLLGTLQQSGSSSKWMSAPNTNIKISDFTSKHLRLFAENLEGKTNRSLSELLALLDDSFNMICTRKTGKEQFFSLCFGHILALAQASVSVDQKGLPAFVQGWNTNPQNCGYMDAKFGIRLGDLRKIDDGMIGFYNCETQKDAYKHIYTHGEYPATKDGYVRANNVIRTSLQSKATEITVLFDPTSVITCRTGFLPAMTQELPTLYYQNQLENIETLFRAAPLLNDLEHFALASPGGFDDAWTFQYVQDSSIKEITRLGEPVTVLQSRAQEILEGFLKANRTE